MKRQQFLIGCCPFCASEHQQEPLPEFPFEPVRFRKPHSGRPEQFQHSFQRGTCLPFDRLLPEFQRCAQPDVISPHESIHQLHPHQWNRSTVHNQGLWQDHKDCPRLQITALAKLHLRNIAGISSCFILILSSSTTNLKVQRMSAGIGCCTAQSSLTSTRRTGKYNHNLTYK